MGAWYRWPDCLLVSVRHGRKKVDRSGMRGNVMKDSEREKVMFEEWWHKFGGEEWHGNGGPDKTSAWIIWQAAYDTATNPMLKR